MSANTGVAPHCQTAFAVAMNDIDGTITSSPAPTPEAYNARCSAVVQLVVAIASGAPTRSRERTLEGLYSGALRDPPGSDHLGEGVGLAAPQERARERNLHQFTPASAAAWAGSRSALPPFDEPAQALIDVDLGLEAQPVAGGRVSASRRGTLLTDSLRAELDVEIGVHHGQQLLGQLAGGWSRCRWRR